LAARSNRTGLVAWLLLAGLIAIRIPSLVQPAGADQALYAYVGQRILAGEVPYRDAWDQKPPAVHLTYAALIALWPHESVVAGADLIVAALTALSLVALGRRLSPYPGAGLTAAVLFLLLANPAFGRLGGVRVRAQCEVFIALAIAAAVLATWRATGAPDRHRRWLMTAGALFGVAALFKYNAVVYGLPVAAVVVLRRADETAWREVVNDIITLVAGAAVPILVMLAWMVGAQALKDLYFATVDYNLQYSGETYPNRRAMIEYLVTFPIRQARLDSLWFVGGLGSAVLIAAVLWERMRRNEGRAVARGAEADSALLLIAPLWVAAACLAIAINGSRGLPQYFLQAGAPLALAAGVAAAWCWPRIHPLSRSVVAALLMIAVLRIGNFSKLAEATAYDLAHMRGETSRRQYLSRFGRADSGDKYSAEAVADLATYLRDRTDPRDRVLVFGFSPWALVGSGRASASRFFWSRPIIIGFEADQPGYGVSGLIDELNRFHPPLVVLQERDWDPDGPNSADFFLANVQLAAWLRDRYEPTGRLHNFQLWRRRP
jgi:hypothetical protein